VVASYKPGDAEKLKVDYETLQEINPRLIYAQITGYGTSDPRVGYDAVIQAESGFTFMNGEAEGPATKMPVALVDVLAAHNIKQGILLALWQRDRVGGSGEGRLISVSLMQAAVSSTVNQATNWLQGGHLPRRMGSSHPNIAPYGTIYATADGKEVVFAVGTDKQFATLCEVLDIRDDGGKLLYENPSFTTNISRVHNRGEVHQRLSEALAGWKDGRSALLEVLHARAVPCGPVNDMSEVFSSSKAAEELVLSGEISGKKGVRQAVFAADEKIDILRPPGYGEHTKEILSSVFQSDAKIEGLIDNGDIVQGVPVV